MKYEKLNFRPPKAVRKAAKRGLELRKKFHRGGLSTQQAGKLGIGSGIARAANLAKGTKIAPQTVKRIHNYFSRHKKDKRKGWANPSKPTNGYIAWLLWGGDPGKTWADKLVRQMNYTDKKR